MSSKCTLRHEKYGENMSRILSFLVLNIDFSYVIYFSYQNDFYGATRIHFGPNDKSSEKKQNKW